MRYLRILIVTGLLGGSVFTSVPAAAAVGPDGCSYGEFVAYRDNNFAPVLGQLCNSGSDANWGNNAGYFKTTDNDAMTAFRLYVGTSAQLPSPYKVMCVDIYSNANYTGNHWRFSVARGLGHIDAVAPGFFDNDVVSSVNVFPSIDSSCVFGD